MSIHRTYVELDLLHPEVRTAFIGLSEALVWAHETGKTETAFGIFETYRSPERQDYLFRVRKTTKARPWQSPHQYGLAADFVPRVNGGWSWAPNHDYEFLKKCAQECGLDVPISWDRCHVEAPEFQSVKHAWA